MRTFILPYNLGSKSAKSLAQSLGVLRVNGSKRFRRGTILVNWGNSTVSPKSRFPLRIFNKPETVAYASNKLNTFRRLASYGVPTVEWTTDRNVALGWIDESTIVYARHKLTAHSGEGIEIVSYGERLPYAPLYTKGFNKTHEYRVHVVNGQVIDFTKKKCRNGVENNGLIKNLANGWVFCRENAILPSKVRLASIAAVQCLGLDFGAVDILYKEREDMARVLEINTAPGLEGTTLEKYKQAIGGMIVQVQGRR